MFGRKFFGILAFVATCAVAMTIVTPAWAETTVRDGVTAPITMNLTPLDGRYLDGNDSVTLNAEVLGTLDEDGIDLTDTSGCAKNIESIYLNPVDFPNGFDKSTANGNARVYVPAKKTLTMTGAFDLKSAAFSTAGTYAYRITRQEAATITDRQSDSVEYFMYVNVVKENSNAENGLVIASVFFVKSKDANGTKLYTEIYGSDPNNPTHYKGADSKADAAYDYTYVPENSSLKISSAVSGEHASKTKDFKITLTLTTSAASWEPAGYEYHIYTYNGDEELVDSGAKYFGTQSDSRTNSIDFELSGGEYVLFSSLPVGSTYTIAVGGANNYQATAEVHTTSNRNSIEESGTALTATVDNTEVSKGMTADQFKAGAVDTKTYGESYCVASVGPLSMAGEDYCNKVVITNEFIAVNPMGIQISDLPNILLIAIPVVALVCWLVFRRVRHAKNR